MRAPSARSSPAPASPAPAFPAPADPPSGARPGRAARLRSAVERDGPRCVWCRRDCTGLVRGTTDHLVPRVKGGPSWLENEVLACPRCNRERGHTGPAEWLAECERRGWEPDGAAVLGALRDLERAIAARGGQRRARPYLAAQLRRLERAGLTCSDQPRPPFGHLR